MPLAAVTFALTAPKKTILLDIVVLKFVPVIVTLVPTGPEAGEKEVNQALLETLAKGIGFRFVSQKGEIEDQQKEKVFPLWTAEWHDFLEKNEKKLEGLTEEQIAYLKNLRFKYARFFDSDEKGVGWELQFYVNKNNKKTIYFGYMDFYSMFYGDDKKGEKLMDEKASIVKQLFLDFGIEKKIKQFPMY